MAKKAGSTGAPTYKSLMTDVRKGQLLPIYLLQGEENWFSDSLADAIRSVAVAEEDRDFNHSVFYGADVNLDEAMGVARSFPMMSDRRLVELREMQSMRDAKRSLERIADSISKLPQTTVIVITFNGDSLGATHPLVKAIKQVGGVVLTSQRPAAWTLGKYITEYCQDKQLTIDRAAQEMLAEFIGADLSRLFATIDKLAASLPEGQRAINAETVEKLTGYSKDFNNNELVNALSRRDFARCMQIVDYFKRNPSKNPVQMTTGFIFNFFSQLTVCHWSPDKTPNGLAQMLDKPSDSRLRLLSETLPRYNARSCIRIIHHIREFDCASKGIGSLQNGHDLLQELIFKIFTS